MCARITLRTPAAILAKMFEFAWEGDFVARSDIHEIVARHVFWFDFENNVIPRIMRLFSRTTGRVHRRNSGLRSCLASD